MRNLTNIDITFKEALEQTISNYAEKARLEISALILHICGEIRPYIVVTEAGAETLADKIFTNDLYRDFIFNLLFNFCPRLSFKDTNNEFADLINVFSFTLAVGDAVKTSQVRDTNTSINKLPTEITSRLPNSEMIKRLLSNNKWLMMVLLINMYVSVEDFEGKKTESVKPKD